MHFFWLETNFLKKFFNSFFFFAFGFLRRRKKEEEGRISRNFKILRNTREIFFCEFRNSVKCFLNKLEFRKKKEEKERNEIFEISKA